MKSNIFFRSSSFVLAFASNLFLEFCSPTSDIFLGSVHFYWFLLLILYSPLLKSLLITIATAIDVSPRVFCFCFCFVSL